MARPKTVHTECYNRDPRFCLDCPYPDCTAVYTCASKAEKEFLEHAIGKRYEKALGGKQDV